MFASPWDGEYTANIMALVKQSSVPNTSVDQEFGMNKIV
jgi:hypothetical protein